jgi:hypothetical protein
VIDTNLVHGVIVISDEDSDELDFEGTPESFDAVKYYDRLFPLKASLLLNQGDK